MCEYCSGEKTQGMRVAIAAEAIGFFSVKAKGDSPDGIEPFVHIVVQKFVSRSQATDHPWKPCDKFESVLVTGIKNAWPDLTLKHKFEYALMAGAIQL